MADFDADAYLSEKPGGFDPDAYLSEKKPDIGRMRALGEGLLSGASANFRDEIYGASRASGLPEILGGFRAPVGAAKLAYEHYTGKPGEASKAYAEAVAHMREIQKQAQEQHPYYYGGGNLAGTVAGMAALPGGAAIKSATLLPKIKAGATLGAEYGALAGAGEGEDLSSRTSGAGIGAVSGGIGGAAGVAGGELIGAGGKLANDYFGKPIASLIRGYRNPEQEGMRRGAAAIMEGQPNVAAGKSPGLTPSEWLAAKQAGEPVMLADMGGETGRALLRSAANTDPEGRALITSAVQDRFEGQGERAGAAIRGLMPGGADAFKTAEKLLSDYNAARGPAYRAAYKAGDRPIRSDELERLASIPAVENAMKSAVTSGANRAGAEGYGGFNPGVTITPDGRIEFAKGPKGIPVYPNLQFWDSAYRDLRDKAGSLFRSGEKDNGSALASLANSMRSELDKIVPQYGNARGVAAKYFGGDNALEAGANAVKFKGDWRELQSTVNKIKDPRERELFTEGYVSELANRMENVPDRNDITKRIFQSPQDRKRIEAVIGPGPTKALQGFIDRETIYDSLRQALGNSTTARQLIEAGLAGGGIGAYLGNGDPKAILAGIGTGIGAGGAGAMAGMQHSIGSLAQSGAQKMIGYVDRNTARKVAEFLTSDDPQKLMQGLALVRNNPRLAAGLRDIADRVSMATGTRAMPAPRIGMQSLGPASADQNQPEVPRPAGQQNDGGRVNQQQGFAHDTQFAEGGAAKGSLAPLGVKAAEWGLWGGNLLAQRAGYAVPAVASSAVYGLNAIPAGVELYDTTHAHPARKSGDILRDQRGGLSVRQTLKKHFDETPMPEYAGGGAVPHGARLAPDGHHYLPDASRPGKYLRIVHRKRGTA